MMKVTIKFQLVKTEKNKVFVGQKQSMKVKSEIKTKKIKT